VVDLIALSPTRVLDDPQVLTASLMLVWDRPEVWYATNEVLKAL
jgi:hypothetical protein